MEKVKGETDRQTASDWVFNLKVNRISEGEILSRGTDG